MSAAVQFRGIDNVIKAYGYKEIPAWALYCGTSLLHKYDGDNIDEGTAMLQEWLNMMGSSSNAIYTLKVYEDLKGKIKDKTPCDGSFNFRLNMEDQLITNSQHRQYDNRLLLEQKMDRIEKLLLGDDDDDDDSEELDEELDTIGRVKQVLETPVVVGLVNKFFGLDIKPQTMGNVNEPGAAATADQQQQINQAIEILKKADKNFAANITKLAILARDNSFVYQMAIAKLNSL